MGRDPKKQKGEKTKGREREESRINKEVMERGWARKAEENREGERGGRKQKSGRGRRKKTDLLPKRKPP